jgi:hypothetical protein
MQVIAIPATIVALFGAFWITWPERTVDKYNQLMASGMGEEAARLVRWEGFGQPNEYRRKRIELQRPGFLDVVFARREIDTVVGGGAVVTIDAVCGNIVIKNHMRSRANELLMASDRVINREIKRPLPWPESAFEPIIRKVWPEEVRYIEPLEDE